MCVGEAPMSTLKSTSASFTRRQVIVGYVLTTLAGLFLTFDTVIKILQLAPAMEGTLALGYPASSVLPIGLIEFASLVLYLVPRTSVLGAVF